MIAFAKIRKRFEGLLDKYPGAAAAYSLKPLSREFLLQPLVKVRRDSDDATQDFPANQITDGSLLAFVGGGDGFVEIWYDQSGNGRNAVQTTLGNQPRIVNAGVLETINGKPTLRFLGSQWFTCGTRAWNAEYSFALGDRSDENDSIARRNTSSHRGQFGDVVGYVWHTAYYLNGSSVASPAVATNTGASYGLRSGTGLKFISSSKLVIGGDVPAYENLIGTLQEWGMWETDQSSNREFIEENINDRYSIF